MTVFYIPMDDWMVGLLLFLFGVVACLSFLTNITDFWLIHKLRKNGNFKLGKYMYSRVKIEEEKKDEE